jgi:hypothetical protein
MSRIRRLLAALFVVLVVIPLAVSATRPLFDRSMIPLEDLTTYDVQSLSIKRHDIPFQDSASSTITDPDAIRRVVASLSLTEPATDHKCASVGDLVFKAANGRRLHCSILPGHDDGFYEIRIRGRGTLRVDRTQFMDAMKAAGVDWLPEKCP